MKKRIIPYLLLLVLVSVVLIITNEIKNQLKYKQENVIEDTTDEEEVIVDGYTYSEVEKRILMLANNDDQLVELNKLIDPLNKSKMLDEAYIEAMLMTLGIDSESILGEEAHICQGTYLTREEFDDLYDELVLSGLIEDVSRQDVYIYAVPDVEKTDYESGINEEERLTFVSATDNYEIDYDEYLPEYEGKVLDCYVKGNYIYKVNGVSISDFTITNVWIKSADDEGAVLYYDGYEKKVSWDADKGAKTTESNAVADVTINTNGIVDIKILQPNVESRVLDVNSVCAIIKDEGVRKFDEDFRCYDVSGDTVRFEDSKAIFMGYKTVKFVIEDKLIQAAVIDQELYGEDIRVLICNDDYTSYEHESVTLECEGAYTVTLPDDTVISGVEGEKYTINSADYNAGDIITVTPEDADSGTRLLTVNRSCGNPYYTGEFKIYIYNGYLNIVNITDVEKYLYSVVSSELSTQGYHEAMKAMAVCARGYAYTKMQDGSFEDYNADLDDSSMCQVYNNQAANDESVKAVRDTYGMVCISGGDIIIPFYYSTSFGCSSTNDEIWGGSAYPYTKFNLETLSKDKVDLSDSEAFEQFLENGMGYEIIEKDMPYYRWSIRYTKSEMTDAVNSNLTARIEAAPDSIRLINEAGEAVEFKYNDEAAIGEVESIEVAERGESGVVKKLIITGSEATIEVTGQTNIRNLISPQNVSIVRQDGTEVKGWTSLPSPYYMVEELGDEYVVRGGGFGHGVGMSQNGAKALAEKGYSCKYILKYYFDNIAIRFTYTIDDGEEVED